MQDTEISSGSIFLMTKANQFSIVFYSIIVNTFCFDKSSIVFLLIKLVRKISFLIADEVGFWSNRKKRKKLFVYIFESVMNVPPSHHME